MKITLDLQFNHIMLDPVPTRNKAKGLKIFSPIFESPTNTGWETTDIKSGQAIYELPAQLKGRTDYALTVEY